MIMDEKKKKRKDAFRTVYLVVPSCNDIKKLKEKERRAYPFKTRKKKKKKKLPRRFFLFLQNRKRKKKNKTKEETNNLYRATRMDNARKRCKEEKKKKNSRSNVCQEKSTSRITLEVQCIFFFISNPTCCRVIYS